MKKIIMLIMIFSLMMVDISIAEEVYNDGIYRGKSGFVTVEILIAGGKISGVNMIKHGGGGEKYAEMVEPICNRIVEKQSTQVDAVTGATVSSRYLCSAVEAALKKASLE